MNGFSFRGAATAGAGPDSALGFAAAPSAAGGVGAGSSLGGNERHAVLPQNRQNLRLTPVDRRLQPALQLVVALRHAHRDGEGERHPQLVLQRDQLDGRVRRRGGVPGQRTPRDRDVHRARDEVVEELPGPVPIAARIEEQRVGRDVVEQAAPREALLGRGVDMHADAKLVKRRRVQRPEVVAAVIPVGHDVGGAVVRLRPEDEVEPFGNPEDDVAGSRVDGVPDEPPLVRPPGVDGGGAELGGDDRGNPVLEPLEPLVRERQVVRIAADAERRRLREYRDDRQRMRRDQRTGPDRDNAAGGDNAPGSTGHGSLRSPGPSQGDPRGSGWSGVARRARLRTNPHFKRASTTGSSSPRAQRRAASRPRRSPCPTPSRRRRRPPRGPRAGPRARGPPRRGGRTTRRFRSRSRCTASRPAR